MGLETFGYIDSLVETNPTGTDPKSQGDDHIRGIKSTLLDTFPNVAGAVTPTHTELNYVDGVTSAIQTQLNTKGAHAGQTWTGAHDYTGGTIAVATQSPGDNTTAAASTAFVYAGLALKANLASPALTGTPTAPTAASSTNTTQIATTAFVQSVATNAALPNQSGNDGKVLQTDGTDATWALTVATEAEAEAGVSATALMTAERVAQAISYQSANEVAILQDQKSSGTAGASLTSGAWNTREVNTEVSDPDGLVTISSNQVTINVPGSYQIEVFAPVGSNAGAAAQARSRLYDVGAAAVIAQGGNVGLGTAGDAATSHVIGILDVATTKTFRVETYAPTGNMYGGNLATVSTGQPEVYMTVIVRKLAGA